jgi:hypothetical protein
MDNLPYEHCINMVGNALLCVAIMAIVTIVSACQVPAPLPTAAPPTASDSLATVAPTPTPAVGLIQLLEPLDEPEFYCVDVPGFGRSLNLQGALTAHTCKPGADDEMFALGQPLPGQIYMPAYSLCVQASRPGPGAELMLARCTDEPLQMFRFNEKSQIQLDAGTDVTLCLTVADEDGEPTGGLSHLRRDLTLEACELTDGARNVWTAGSPNVVKSKPASSD